MKRVATRSRIRQMCSTGVCTVYLVPSLLPAIRSLIGCERASFVRISPCGEIISIYADWMPPEDELSRIFAPIQARVVQQVRASGPLVPTSLRVDMYPGLRDERTDHILCCGVRQEDGDVEVICMHRHPSKPAFSEADAVELRAAVRYFSMARPDTSPPRALDFRQTNDAAVLLIDRSNEVRQSTRRGLGMLLAMRQTARTEEKRTDPLEMLLAQPLAYRTDNGIAFICDSPWARYALTAYSPLQGSRDEELLTPIEIRRLEPLIFGVIDAICSLGLSTRQIEIALSTWHGKSKEEIAACFSISVNTVAYHTKQLYSRLGVHDRAGLVALISSSSVGSRFQRDDGLRTLNAVERRMDSSEMGQEECGDSLAA